jgi:hypothetical protein
MTRYFCAFFLLLAVNGWAKELPEWQKFKQRGYGKNPTVEEVHRYIGRLKLFSKYGPFIEGIVWKESECHQFRSNGKPYICGEDAGIAQVNKRTMAGLKMDWERCKWDYKDNIQCALIIFESKIKYAKYLKKKYPAKFKNSGTIELAICAYNGVSDSKDYVEDVIAIMQEKPWKRYLK